MSLTRASRGVKLHPFPASTSDAQGSKLQSVTVRLARDFEGLRVLAEYWPVIVIEFPETRVPDSALHDCLFHLEALLKEAKERGGRTYTVTDLTRMHEFPPESQRKYAAEWMTRTLPMQKAASLGGATVTRVSMLRAIINAVYWVSPPAMPSIFVATRQEAFAEALNAFDAARMPLGAELRAALAKR